MASTDVELGIAAYRHRKRKRPTPGSVLLIKVGAQFYEAYDEDARIVADVCDVVLTSMGVGTGHRVPMAGLSRDLLGQYVDAVISKGIAVEIVPALLGPIPVDDDMLALGEAM